MNRLLSSLKALRAILTRAAAIILFRNDVALIERRRPGETYYLFPGGTVEPGESDLETVVREVREELGLDVRVGPLVADIAYRGQSQRYYLVTSIGEQIDSRKQPLLSSPEAADDFQPLWAPIGSLLEKPVHPRIVAELIVSSSLKGWPAEPLRATDEGRLARSV